MQKSIKETCESIVQLAGELAKRERQNAATDKLDSSEKISLATAPKSTTHRPSNLLLFQVQNKRSLS